MKKCLKDELRIINLDSKSNIEKELSFLFEDEQIVIKPLLNMCKVTYPLLIFAYDNNYITKEELDNYLSLDVTKKNVRFILSQISESFKNNRDFVTTMRLEKLTSELTHFVDSNPFKRKIEMKKRYNYVTKYSNDAIKFHKLKKKTLLRAKRKVARYN